MPGTGNQTCDPLFVNVSNENFALSANSSCIQAGKMGYDIGAIESQTIPCAVSNVNFQQTPLLMLTWDSPTQNTQGQALPYLSTCNVFRDGELVHTFPTSRITSQMHYIDYDCAPGERHRYSINTTKDGALGWHFDTANFRFIPDNQGVIPYPPENLQASALPSSVIELTWQLPDAATPGFYQPQNICIYREDEQIEVLEGSATSYIDQVAPGNEVSYYVTAVYINPDWESHPSETIFVMPTGCNDVPGVEKAELDCYPNPFNPTTTIQYTLPQNAQKCRIDIFDVKGRLTVKLELNNDNESASSIIWDGTDSNGQTVSSGMYLYRLVADGVSVAQNRMMLIK